MESKDKAVSQEIELVPRGEEGGIPLYLQVASVLKEEILAGVYPVGSQLPRQDQLCGRFSISRFTVREAIRKLSEEGLVQTRRRTGATVVPSSASEDHMHHTVAMNDMLVFEADTRLRIGTIGMVKVSKKIAARIGVEAGGEWLSVRGYRYSGGIGPAVCHAEYYINPEYASIGRLLKRHDGPVFPLLEDLFGISIVEVDQKIGATLMPVEHEAELDTASGLPALEIIRTYRLTDRKIAQITINLHAGSRYQHEVTMRRVVRYQHP